MPYWFFSAQLYTNSHKIQEAFQRNKRFNHASQHVKLIQPQMSCSVNKQAKLYGSITIERWEIIMRVCFRKMMISPSLQWLLTQLQEIEHKLKSAHRFRFARQCMLWGKSTFVCSSRSALRPTGYRQTRLQYETSGFCIINAWLELKCLPLLMILCHQAGWPYSRSDLFEFMSHSTQRISITTKVESTHLRGRMNLTVIQLTDVRYCSYSSLWKPCKMLSDF